MTISFFGHSEICDTAELEKKLFFALKEVLNDEPCELLFGGYGMFDSLAYRCCRKLIDNGNCYKLKFIFVTPYVTESYLKNQTSNKTLVFDEIVYPPIEKTPYRFAITARNRWMVENSDIVITYVKKSSGGAYSAKHHAEKHGKMVINIVDKIEEKNRLFD
jgi:hypothetical protein